MSMHACVIGLSGRALSSIFKAYSLTISLVSANGCHGRTAVSFYSSNTSVCLCVVLLLSEPADGHLCPLPVTGKLHACSLQSCLYTHIDL